MVSCAAYLKMLLNGLPEEKRKHCRPANILMKGSTGVGKTEIARRLAEIMDVPFVIFPVTRLSERGYVGGNTEDLVGSVIAKAFEWVSEKEEKAAPKKNAELAAVEEFREKMIAAKSRNLDGVSFVAIMDPKGANLPVPVDMLGIGFMQYRAIIKNLLDLERSPDSNHAENKLMKTIDAAEKAIVFLDEIDKICEPPSSHGMVSREGVQNELLPIVEGSTYDIKDGVQLKTDRILFVAAGAFTVSSPDSLIPELSGRFPVRINLNDLENTSVYRAILDTKCSVTKQYETILSSNHRGFSFTDDAKKLIADLAFYLNKETSMDMGARALDRVAQASVNEYLLSGISGKLGADIVGEGYRGFIEPDIDIRGSKRKPGFIEDSKNAAMVPLPGVLEKPQKTKRNKK